MSKFVVEWHARLEPNWRIPPPPVWLAAGVSGALIAVALLGRSSGRKLWRVLTFSSLAGLAGLLLVMIWHPFPPAVVGNALEITAIDVGQGDSIFVALPSGKLMLMDGGGIASFGKQVKSNLNIGEDVVSPYLWSRSIRRLDVVALSHAHQDHIGGLASVLENFHVKELWTGATPECEEWAALRWKATELHVKIVPLEQGQHFDYGGAQFEVLAPAATYVPAATPRNNDSLVLQLAYGRRSVILTGDMERQIESELMAAGLLRHADVLKVAHHGSKTSTTEPFLDSVHPAFALISVGFENLYGHPHADVLDRLNQARIGIFRTDQAGAITIRTDGWHMEVNTAAGF